MGNREPQGDELIERYKNNYCMPPDADISEEMILRHWELEQRLTKELLASSPHDRWETFDRCYTALFAELDWLNKYAERDLGMSPAELYGEWADIVGEPPKKIYEIGSGRGELIKYLAERGHECRGSEVTRERGEGSAGGSPHLTWGVSDGVHLGRFERSGTYDAVISNNVIEHLHPDDLIDHLSGVRSILKEGGKYLFTTPHAYTGPSDISRVFGRDAPEGMHLREYTYGDVLNALTISGWARVRAVWKVPRRVASLTGLNSTASPSCLYLYHLRMIERCISLLPRQSYKRRMARLFRLVLFREAVFLVAEK